MSCQYRLSARSTSGQKRLVEVRHCEVCVIGLSFLFNIVPSRCVMKPDLDESLLSQFHAPIFDGAKGEEATRAMPVSDAGFRSLEGMLGGPMELGTFLRIAIAIASALGRVHQQRLVHKDIKPANILVNPDSGEVRFTGFGLSSRMARERAQPRPPEFIAGTLAYMAPEQTGRMNRSVDSRSDLYALGVTLYQMLTGTLPFT